MLIIFGGLPGVGKTTIARELARRLGAVHIRIDTIETAIRESGVTVVSLDDAGYRVAYAVTEDNLRLGRTVIADSVNPLPITRTAWRDVAKRANMPAIEVEVVCSNQDAHRHRVEQRRQDTGATGPTWHDVITRDYRSWDRAHTVVDTAAETLDSVVTTLVALATARPPDS